jgi:uncharacterized protein YjbI with pentapeptide repeats
MRRRIILLLGFVLLIFLLLGFLTMLFDKYGWSTGFGDRTRKVEPDEEYEHGKTLWDWLELLIVPAAIGLGALWFNSRSRKTDLEITNDRIYEERLQSYLDRMTELLLEKGLRASQSSDEVRVVAGARTLTTARTLDSQRKGLLLRFLHESDLITAERQPESETVATRIIDLKDVDLSEANLIRANLEKADLRGVFLHKADLRRANLHKADLCGAILIRADLRGAFLNEAKLERADLKGANLHGTDLNNAKLSLANLEGANLEGVDLTWADLRAAPLNQANLNRATLYGANLSRAELKGANLKGADLRVADLSEANLEKAKVTTEQLGEARSLEGAIMPNGERPVRVRRFLDRLLRHIKKQ